MAVAETVHRFLVQHSIDYDLVPHPHTGSSHETAVEIKHLRKELDRELHLAEEDEIGKLFADCEVGAVPPLGPAYGIETFLDRSVVTLANVYFEAGDHEELVHVSGEAFETLLSGARQGYYSHDE